MQTVLMINNIDTHKKLSLVLFLLVLLITLLFGLIPRGNFKANWVEYDPKQDAILFKEYGYALGSLSKTDIHPSNSFYTHLSLTLMMHEQNEPTFRVLVYIGESCEDKPFIIGQWRSHLIVLQGCDFRNQSKLVRLSHDMKPHLGLMTTVSITLNHAANELRVNDKLVLTKVGTLYSATNESTHQILVGNSPDGQRGWTGSIAGLSINQISRATGKSNTLRDYQFATYNNTDTILDASAVDEPLRIPSPGQFQQLNRLSRISLSNLLLNQLLDVTVNLIGFIPIGFATALMLNRWFGLRRAPLLLGTVLLATTVSLTIELSQVYIAGRKSNLHDLVLNSSGSIFGFGAFYLVVLLRSMVIRKP